MARKQSPDNLSMDELRYLLIEKRRKERQDRLEHFRKTGRVVLIAPDPIPDALQPLRSEELLDEEGILARNEPSPSRRKRFFDRFLFVVEIAAVVGLVFVLFNGFSLIKNLNSEFSAALEQPTLTPTPLIVAVVLPSGHIFSADPGSVKPNDAEIPEHLRPLVQTLANMPTPTPGPEQAVRIQIPAIAVDAPIVSGDGWDQLKKGVGQNVNSANPGQSGNVVLSAHNDIFGELFRDLDRLKPGDEVILFTSQRQYVYIVRKSQIVSPTQVDVMAPTDKPVVTLISCYPYMVDKKRIVISAELQSNS